MLFWISHICFVNFNNLLSIKKMIVSLHLCFFLIFYKELQCNVRSPPSIHACVWQWIHMWKVTPCLFATNSIIWVQYLCIYFAYNLFVFLRKKGDWLETHNVPQRGHPTTVEEVGLCARKYDNNSRLNSLHSWGRGGIWPSNEHDNPHFDNA